MEKMETLLGSGRWLMSGKTEEEKRWMGNRERLDFAKEGSRNL